MLSSYIKIVHKHFTTQVTGNLKETSSSLLIWIMILFPQKIQTQTTYV